MLVQQGSPFEELISAELKDPGANLVALARQGDKAKVDDLLSSRTSPNSYDWMGRTALHRAVRYGHEDIVQLLLAADARVDFLDADERSALHTACKHKEQAILERLIAHGVRTIGAQQLISPCSNDLLTTIRMQGRGHSHTSCKGQIGTGLEPEVKRPLCPGQTLRAQPQ